MDTPVKFVSFEGTEGVGKTTAVDGFCRHLETLGIEYVRTREPGGADVAETLRSILLDKDSLLNDDTELLLMFAARADHLHKTILPALADGKWVVCDRFIDSTVAYQGFGRLGGDVQALAKIDLLIDHFVPRLPDITLWLDLDVRVGMMRAKNRSQADRFESLTIDFFNRVYQGLCHQLDKNPDRMSRIDASGDADVVLMRICQAVGLWSNGRIIK
ncbi:dTMP kinase [Moraxella sp. Tifton1]|uniref:dTMP kinase n=1 Tax=Moraxella oculi TaxID=2940516 RepID=UPI002012AE35|nr:dTMP kinase [Moraxella sp. Tifton1]